MPSRGSRTKDHAGRQAAKHPQSDTDKMLRRSVESRIATEPYDVIHDHGAVPIKPWTRGVPPQDEACKQLQNIPKLPFIHRWMSAMPDVHLGKGATVGSVVPTIGGMPAAACAWENAPGLAVDGWSQLVADFEKTCKDADVVDESPAAYKSIDAVMEAQKDLVEIVHTLRRVVCVKG